MTIKIVLADDHAIVRNGIKALLESDEEIEVVGEASDGIQAVEIVEELQPDIVIMDIRMPNLNGIEATRKISKKFLQTRVLILSMHDNEEYVLQSIECGASGYLLKDIEREEFIKAIKEVAQGKKYFSSPVANVLADNYLHNKSKAFTYAPINPLRFDLTDKEKQILENIAQGLSNKEIAEKLEKSIRTVETQRFKLMKKLGVKNAIELVNLAKDNQLIDQHHFSED